MMKSTPKSCSCGHCRAAKRCNAGKTVLKLFERAFRHRSKQCLTQGGELLAPAPKTARLG